jgi:hypothetical protein
MGVIWLEYVDKKLGIVLFTVNSILMMLNSSLFVSHIVACFEMDNKKHLGLQLGYFNNKTEFLSCK